MVCKLPLKYLSQFGNLKFNKTLKELNKDFNEQCKLFFEKTIESIEFLIDEKFQFKTGENLFSMFKVSKRIRI